MYEFQQKRKVRQIIYSKWSLLFLAVIVILLAKGNWGVIRKELGSRQNLNNVEKELLLVKEKETELRSNIYKLNTPEGVESEIRSRFSVKKPGEEVVLIVEPSNSTSTQDQSNSFWSKIGRWFKKLF